MHVCGSQKSTLCVIPQAQSIFIFETGSLTGLELIYYTRLAHSSWDPPISGLSTLSYRHVSPHPTLYVDSGGLDSGPHVCVENTSAKQPPTPSYLSLYR